MRRLSCVAMALLCATACRSSPKLDEDALLDAVRESDDHFRHQSSFAQAALELGRRGDCTADDFAKNGGWTRSPSKTGGAITTYFVWCGSTRWYVSVPSALDGDDGETYRLFK